MSNSHEESRMRMNIWCAKDYQARKAARTEYYEKFVKGWKMIPCSGCNGSGWYDNTDRYGNTPRCSSCEGTGKERVSPEEYKRHLKVKTILKEW